MLRRYPTPRAHCLSFLHRKEICRRCGTASTGCGFVSGVGRSGAPTPSLSFSRAGDPAWPRQPKHAKSQPVHHLLRVRERVWVRHHGGAPQLPAASSATNRRTYSGRAILEGRPACAWTAGDPEVGSTRWRSRGAEAPALSRDCPNPGPIGWAPVQRLRALNSTWSRPLCP